ncbi:MAG: hypothetical protein KUF77_09675 [Candidatus Thiodiazotropha sp. (ex Lucina aurantia)]|nr:hypothetical protein [Candidatus Thiodiazotropha taylori]MBV2097849.1 hypothetical protein [Candidatus Thiodiazotropha sp. (ex Codakia orbicularis)]MBV2103278.1 hypothetical protein [Candidatus Thiodiazotropha sp. (ex Lucina aurantia)]MBV2116359.1 hypothetical protein [Candidatus Thiodiazotropha sp. (ex Lucina aurantia)]
MNENEATIDASQPPQTVAPVTQDLPEQDAQVETKPDKLKPWEEYELQDHQALDADALDWETTWEDDFDIHHELGIDFGQDNGMER